MKKDIILAGVGGQGILSIAAIIGHAAVNSGLYLKQAEVHGMSQRGGDVQSNLRLSDQPVASDLIPHGQADMILSVEPMESLRYLPFLHQNGWLITNTQPFINIPDYPDPEKILSEIRKIRKHIAIDADQLASELGTSKASNIVMLGAASDFLDISHDNIQDAIRFFFGKKSQQLVDLNLKALDKGRVVANQYIQ